MTRVSSSFVSSCISQFTSEYADNFISQQDLSTFLHSYSTGTNTAAPSFESLDPFVQIAFARFVCGGNEQCRLDILTGDKELGYIIRPDDDELEQKVQDLCMALYLHGQEFHGETLQGYHVDLYFLLGFDHEIEGDFMVDHGDTLNGVSTVLYNVMYWKTFIVRSLGRSGDRLLQSIPPSLDEAVQYTEYQFTSCPDEFTISTSCVLLSSRMQMYADPSRFTVEDVTKEVHSIVKESMDLGTFIQQLNDLEMDTGVENDVKEILYVDPDAVSPTFMPSTFPSFMPSISPSLEESFIPTNVVSSAPSIKSSTTNTTASISTNTTTSTTDKDDGSRGTPDGGSDPSPQKNNVDSDSIVVIATLGIMLITLLILFTVKKYQLKQRERQSHLEEEEEDMAEVDEEIMGSNFGGEQSESISSLEVE
ncbi:predicted protein [Chaetoceros tenuissimus]|uniref:PI-PLC Y-box domain-containing protein n=1 Tax=Chaetoceros tenuissimus TaxID=426638 RepID=A0AAD3GYT6_9STRA|nr:predicted protein [Chaetoceros tenuissimus]